MGGSDPRRLAFEILLEVEKGRVFADAALGNALDDATELSPENRRLATILVYGTLARQGSLDFTIRTLAQRSPRRLERRVRVLLRLGLFQITCLDRVPAYAAVDTTVALARAASPRAAGLINAVLRKAASGGPVPPPSNDRERLAVEVSHPAWMVERVLDTLGNTDGKAFLESNNHSMPTVLRALAPRSEVLATIAKRGVRAGPAPYAPDAIVGDLPLTLTGVVVPQSEASQLVTLLADADSGNRVLDTCAAPGGKSAYLAALVKPGGEVIAVDSAPGAAERLSRTLATTMVTNVRVVESSIQDLPVQRPFDVVFVDVPCSGLGTLREHPEIRWRRSPSDIDTLAHRQHSILSAAARHVRSGGRLVYTTCTVLPAENDEVVNRFLAEHADFTEEPDPPRAPELRPFLGSDGRFRSFPHRHGIGGFFGARLRRR